LNATSNKTDSQRAMKGRGTICASVGRAGVKGSVLFNIEAKWAAEEIGKMICFGLFHFWFEYPLFDIRYSPIGVPFAVPCSRLMLVPPLRGLFGY
jgi:hypothetical protein